MVTCASGIELLDRLRQQVRGRVADDLQSVRILVRDDGERCVVIDDVRGIDELAIDTPGERRARQSRANAGGHFVHRHRVVELALAAIGQSNDGHVGFTVRLGSRRLDFSPGNEKGRRRFTASALFGHLVGASGIEPPTTTMSR